MGNKQKNKNNEFEEEEEPIECMSEYGQSLFSCFCNHRSTTSINIRNYKSLPIELQKSLLLKKSMDQISLIPIARSFWFLSEINLNNLNLEQMIADSAHFVKAVLEYINVFNKEYTICDLKKIQFQSGPQEHRMENVKLKKVSRTLFAVFTQYNWHISYSFDVNALIHSLIFVNAEAPIQSQQHKTKELNVEKLSVDLGNVHSNYVQHGIIAKTPTIFEEETVSISKHMTLNAAWDDVPDYFMQITAIHEDHINVELSANEINEKMRVRFRIIDIDE